MGQRKELPLRHKLEQLVDQLPHPGFGYSDLWPFLPSADPRSLTPADLHPDNFDSARLWSVYVESQRIEYVEEPRMSRFWLLFSDYQNADLGITAGQIDLENFLQLYSRFYQDVTRGSPVGFGGLADLGFMWSKLIKNQSQALVLDPNPLVWRGLANEVQELTLSAIRRIANPVARASYLSYGATVFPGTDFSQEIAKLAQGAIAKLDRLTPADLSRDDLFDTISKLSRLSATHPAIDAALHKLLFHPDIDRFHPHTINALAQHSAVSQVLSEPERSRFLAKIDTILALWPHGQHRDSLLEHLTYHHCQRTDFDSALRVWRQIDDEAHLNFPIKRLVTLALKQGRIEEFRHEFEKTYVPKLVQSRLSFRRPSTTVPPANSVEVSRIAHDATHWWSLHWFFALCFMPEIDWMSVPEVRCFFLDERDNSFALDELLGQQLRHPHPWVDHLIHRNFERSAQKYNPLRDSRSHGAATLAKGLLKWRAATHPPSPTAS